MSKTSNREGKADCDCFWGWGWGGSLCPGFGSGHTLVLEGCAFPTTGYYASERHPPPPPPRRRSSQRKQPGKTANRGPFTLKHSCFCRKAKDYKDLAVWGDFFPPIPCAETKSGEMPQIIWGEFRKCTTCSFYEIIVLNVNFFFSHALFLWSINRPAVFWFNGFVSFQPIIRI